MRLFRFVKSPGLRTTNIKIGKEDLEFFPIQLNRCRVDDLIEKESVSGFDGKKYLEVLRKHCLDLQIIPLFHNDPNERLLPIKHAHITVEIYLQ